MIRVPDYLMLGANSLFAACDDCGTALVGEEKLFCTPCANEYHTVEDAYAWGMMLSGMVAVEQVQDFFSRANSDMNDIIVAILSLRQQMKAFAPQIETTLVPYPGEKVKETSKKPIQTQEDADAAYKAAEKGASKA